jgi:DNA-binding transcriptional LysR family regulator
MSITLAAQDLCVTQSAVSRQVHALEAHLGVALLQRGYRKIAFTPEGERLFRVADAALLSLQDTVAALRPRASASP